MNDLVFLLPLFACVIASPLFPFDVELDDFQDLEANGTKDEFSGDKIIGGSNTNIERIPWQLSLQFRNSHLCGASVLSPTTGLTAAHCHLRRFPQLNLYSIQAGSTLRVNQNAVRTNINRFLSHPNYNERTHDNDIALVRFTTRLQFGPTIQPIRIPAQNAPVPYGTPALVSGWGRTREGDSNSLATVLQSVTVPLITNQQCNQPYRGAILNSMVCAGVRQGGRDACQNDSGGPLVANGVQVGVVSFGKGCGRPNFPGVYARVSVFTTWIQNNMS